jgi:hypothetical protein
MMRGRWSVAVVLAIAASLPVVALAAEPTSEWHPPTTEAEAQRRADNDAHHRAALVVMPPGAREVARLPGHLGLGKPVVPTSSRWIDLVSRWRIDWPVPKVIAYFRSHRPAGARVDDEGAQVYRGKAIEHGLEISWDQYEWWASERDAYLRLVPDGTGTAIRLDTVASWRRPEPSADIVPTTGFLKIELVRGEPTKTRQIAEITDRATIATVAATINAAPFFGPHTKVTCPEGYDGDLWLTFRAAPKGKRIASVRQELPSCAYSLEPEVENKLSHDRTEGQPLVELVETLLPPPEPVRPNGPRR